VIRAVGFDVGDTLLFYADTPLNWSALYGDALAAVARACDVSPSLGEITAACDILLHYNTRVRPRTSEVTADEIFSRILRRWSLAPAKYLEIGVDSFFAFFQQRMRVFPETLSVLRRLREAGLRLGALTDVPYGMPMKFVQRDLEGAQIANLFESVMTSATAGFRKPDPTGYRALASSLGVAADEMLYVGNEPKDVIGAQRAGVPSVLIDRSGVAANHGQDFTIASLEDIIDIACPAV
jgi:putative hydrolase of the HAD superfamily